MSASISSISMVSTSSIGGDLAGDVDDVGVLEAADHLEDGVHLADVAEEGLFPSPSPSLAPFTIPAMSTRRRAAGTSFLGTMYLVIRCRRSSGTLTTPSFGSMVQNG